jgi:hypothetical protein
LKTGKPKSNYHDLKERGVGTLPAFFFPTESAAHAPFLKTQALPAYGSASGLDYELMRAEREKGEAIRKEVKHARLKCWKW